MEQRPSTTAAGRLLPPLLPMLLLLLLLLLLTPPASAAVQQDHSVTYNRADSYNTNANLAESALTPANIGDGPNLFGLLFRTPLDGGVIYSGVLHMANLPFANGGVQDGVFVATNLNNVFAVNALSGAIIWTTSVQRAVHGGVVAPLPSTDTAGGGTTPWGVTSTPVIDEATGSIFVVSAVKETAAPGVILHYYHQLWQLSLTTGVVMQSSIISEHTATCTVTGAICLATGPNGGWVSGPAIALSTAADAVGGAMYFNALRQLQRPGLNIFNATVIVGFGSIGAIAPYHGWVLGFSKWSLAPTFVFVDTPNGGKGGIWGAGGKLPVDKDGYIYAATGNGDSAAAGWTPLGFPVDGAYADSVVKLAIDPTLTPVSGYTNGWGVRVVDFWTAYNAVYLGDMDLDIGSTGVLLIPDGTIPAFPKLLVVCSKLAIMYVVDRTNMGRFSASQDNIVATLALPTGGLQALQGTSFFNGAGGPVLYQAVNNGPGFMVGLNGDGSLTLLNATAPVNGEGVGEMRGLHQRMGGDMRGVDEPH